VPKRQVFISHIYEERGVGSILQEHIYRAFGGKIPVFSAFDKASIGGGKKWFTHIIQNLQESALVLVLVSHESRRRQWINFEAGYGGGAGAEIIPVSIRNFSLGKLEYPLAGFQGRSIDDIHSIVADISNTLGMTSDRVDIDAYLAAIREAEAKLIYKSLRVWPFVQGIELNFELTNEGNTDVELIMLEVFVPHQYVIANSLYLRFMHYQIAMRSGIQYTHLACTSGRGAYGGVEPCLPPILTPSMETIRIRQMVVALTGVSPSDSNLIHYQIHAVDYPTGMESKSWADLEFR
jgi:hypothetical protein